MAETVAIISSVFGCATVVVTLVAPCLRDPLSEQYTLFRKRKENLEKLKREMENLGQRRKEVERQSKVKVVKKSLKVSEWLQETQFALTSIEADILNFEGRIRGRCCGLPHYWSQYKVGKKIDGKVRQLEALQKEGEKFIDVQESDVVGQMIDTKNLVGTAASKVKEIMDCVTGNKFGTILVHGMAGSGKTQIVSRVNNKILGVNNSNGNSEDRFDKVICVTVENEGSTVNNLQKKIAEKLQIDFNNAPGSRADTLADALKRKRYLIILDDMWKNLSLEEIGIPRPTKDNGCKVIIVSRSLPVGCGIKFEKKVETHLLSVIESKELFESEAGIELSELSQDTVATAKHMIDECQGLPLAIFSLAQILTELKMDDSGDVKAAWKKAFNNLKRHHLESMNERAFARLKYSYDMLKKESQQCFLFCALYPSGHDIEKKELVEHWFWEGLLDCRGGKRQMEDMTQAILDELTRAHLVQETVSQESGKECIKMPNLVRHMAVHLTKTSAHQFLIKAGEKLTKIPFQGENWSQVERASLIGNQLRTLNEAPECPKLSTLLLQKNPIVLWHYNFFSRMPNIKRLDLSHTEIDSLPKSTFSNLKQLRALLLRNCPNLKSLPSLAMSKKLLVLDLSGTPIERLPDGMKKLTNLIRLNLSRTNVQVGEFQAELLRALVCLEELLMITNSASFWGSAKGESIEDLGALQTLDILHINFLDAEAFNRYVSPKHHCPSKFKFCVGGSWENKLPENTVVFIESDFKEKPISLPKDTFELHVMRNLDLPQLQVTCRLNSLKVINISGCKRLVYLFKIDMLYNLPVLETISVDKCQKMEGLIESNSADPPQVRPHLKHLKVIHISDCENLVYLFRKEMYFPSLHDICIRQRQKNQVQKESIESNVFPAMPPGEQELVLVDPLKLRNMYNGEKEGNSQQTIWNFPELNMKIITSLLPKTSDESDDTKKNDQKMSRTRSFESVWEAAPSAFGALSRTVSSRSDDKGLSSHSAHLITPPRDSESIIQNRKDNPQSNPDPNNISTTISQYLYAIPTFVGSAIRHPLLNPSVPNLKRLQMDNEVKTIDPSSSSLAQFS